MQKQYKSLATSFKNKAFKSFDELKKVISRANKRFYRKKPGISIGKKTISNGKSENGSGKEQ